MDVDERSGGTRLTLILISLAFLILAAATVYFSFQEIRAFEVRHVTTLTTQVDEAANDVEQFIESRQSLVQTFAFEKQTDLNALELDTSDDHKHAHISASLTRWFPNYFTFTIADESGTDLVDDFDGFVGPQCKQNIQEYVKSLRHSPAEHVSYKTVIHPQANNYHFDVMAPWVDDDHVKGAFFVSFRPDSLAHILKSHQSDGHYLALLNKDRGSLIEVNADGARDQIAASRDINLTEEELQQIYHSNDISGSQWRLVGYLEPGLLAAAAREIWTNAAILLAIITLVWGLSCRKISQLATAEQGAFAALEKSNADLAMMAEEQKNLRVAAESGEKTKAQFLASMSHEIRTPLNAVIGLTDLVMKTELTDHQRSYLGKVSLAGRNLLGLINDILDFSKIEAGKLTIEEVEFELDPVLENMSVVVSTKAEENGNELIISVDRAIPNLLLGDPLRLGQILINLAGNAAKFTENGEIIVDIALEENDGNWLVVSVEDNGSGMTEDQVSKLFKPFVQADQSVTRTHGGTGLGLSISQQLVEAMGGTIGVKSDAGSGSTFFFRIPIKFSENAQRRDVFEGVDPRAIRILVVDDNETICATLKAALEKLRFNVDTALSGAQAVEKYKTSLANRAYNALLIDWKMQGVDGIETIREIRSLEGQGASTPAIGMISASDMSTIQDQLTELGIKCALQKPINTSFLVDALMVIFQSTTDRRPIRSSVIVDDDAKLSLQGARVLLAEDNELNQMVALGVLENLGCSVDVAENGQLAIDMLRDKPADHYAIVLMDIQMPVLDGLSATEMIRSDLKMTDLPIVAMTAHALEEERERCAEAGMDDHISKPIDALDVQMKMLKWVGSEFQSDSSDEAPAETAEPETVQFNEAPVVDVQAVAARLMLSEEMVQKLLLRFCDDYADTPEKLRSLIQSGDLAGAEHLAHSVKGVSATLGIEDVQQRFGELEESFRAGTFDPAVWDDTELTMAFESDVANIRKAIPEPRS